MAKTYVAYLRVSTNRQGVSGLGLEAQREAVTRYADQTGGTLVSEVLEVESGKLRDRPGLVEALAACRRTSSCLLIARLDRLARNVAFVSSLMEAGTEFVAVDAPYANRLMLHILAAFAEHERDLVSARTKAALAAAKARGVRLGINGSKLAAVRRAEAVAWAETMRPVFDQLIANGASTLREYADALNAAGHGTREGGRWHPSTVARTMHRLGLPQPHRS